MHFGTTVSIISTLLLTCCQQFVLITLPCFSDQRTILACRPSASGPAFSGDPRSVRARVRQPRSVTARLDHIRRSHVVDDVIGQLFVRSPLPHRRLLPCREIDERQRRRRKSGGGEGRRMERSAVLQAHLRYVYGRMIAWPAFANPFRHRLKLRYATPVAVCRCTASYRTFVSNDRRNDDSQSRKMH